MRCFCVDRNYDTATVTIAQGVEFDDGTVALRFLTRARSTAIYANIKDVESVHLGEDSTIVWANDHDDPGISD